MKDRANQLVLAPWFEYRIIAGSVPLLIGCWSQPAIAALAIKNINATMGWHSKSGLTTYEAGVSSGGNVL
ncbi:MAG: hypothetical protein ABIU05_10270 [Nitrospirales bacterium]